MTDNRSSSALFKRAEQLKRWEESDTNKQSPTPRRASRIQFSSGIVFLAACTAGDKDEVQRLLKRGADINTANVDGLTALHQACIDDNLDMVEFLVTHGADVNRGDNEGWTPLHATSSCGFLSIARYLLENGADVAAVNYDGELPVDIAESDEMAELLQKVIDEKGVDCDKSRSAEVDTLLSDARNWAANGYVEVRDMNGGTPLHVAAAKGYIDVATTLLEECSADPDCVDYEGWTPLHAAALWGQKDAAALLLQYGADPLIKNYSGQTCMDLVDPTMTSWLADAMNAQRRMNNNNNKRKRSPPQHDAKRVDIEINSQPEKVVNGENSKTVNNAVDNDTILRRTHSFENDKRINPSDRREREVNTWSGPTTTTPSASPTNTTTTTTVRSSAESVESNSTNTSPSSATPTKLSPGNIFKNFFKSFVPPVRDEESETQRKAHAKRVRETRRSTQGVTLDEIKSAEQLVKKKAGNGTTESPSPGSPKKDDPTPTPAPAPTDNGSARSSTPAGDVAVSLALACASATATATIAANSERRPSWRLRLDPTNKCVNFKKFFRYDTKFELEDAGRSSPRPATTAAEATVTLPYRRPPTGSNANTTTSTPKDDNRTEPSGEEDKERESSTESKSSSNASPASTQAALNVIQRRRRPKRRSTGVGHVDMDDIVNDRGGGGEGCDADNEAPASGSERTEESEDKDYKALYEASQSEVRRLRALLATSEQQLREARGTITRLTQVNQNSLSEIEKREKRAMERKLSEMEEELKQLQKLKAENERLRAENRALTRVVSKLTNSAAK
ncbi:protein phosphatase 1 regulatory subunit 12A isoform X35 [Spodoptera frugiperda]|uniref:Protein phosphatase 1 regulatory subunit 12A isoform X34 n=1 Tax=Spodoptera frugiperda TaxID=7108 RepID=A0A9R0D0U8_SPOFR|nr:protein phosphatase 1 regulatory subunit 12A isoform X34 [Spodoptera frugiperda]XP_050559937.1 protein phosphatase 1 regulatory subunit 12A isoform X35 [Spodoptera frugiperda]